MSWKCAEIEKMGWSRYSFSHGVGLPLIYISFRRPPTCQKFGTPALPQSPRDIWLDKQLPPCQRK
ncbi:hypothetical protein DL93DRAFT_2092248 [Clavulina sp. PMI_390]|nr:hypothetical protein DL93DRAFT_2092249 [Clavulina sp. PMI_390]KAF8286973.1 hypothetical protein DL93DRAFT_2092248 [Clavulina sp. PMI_390]